jgi:hypothetical protein
MSQHNRFGDGDMESESFCEMYQYLQSNISTWVEVNCDAVLDNQTLGIELSDCFHPTAMNAYQQVVMWLGAKNHVL